MKNKHLIYAGLVSFSFILQIIDLCFISFGNYFFMDCMFTNMWMETLLFAVFAGGGRFQALLCISLYFLGYFWMILTIIKLLRKKMKWLLSPVLMMVLNIVLSMRVIYGWPYMPFGLLWQFAFLTIFLCAFLKECKRVEKSKSDL